MTDGEEAEGQAASVKVVVRVRPLDAGDERMRTVAVLDDRVLEFDPKGIPSRESLLATVRRSTTTKRRPRASRYAFDVVLGEAATQAQVFEATAAPLVGAVLAGVSATVFAYGATGCGKTHTVTGTPSDPGLVPRTVAALYERIATLAPAASASVALSYLEVYNESIRDLLTPNASSMVSNLNSSNSSASLDLREDAGRVVVAGLSEHSPASTDEVLALLVRGNEARARAPTEANAVSSRSHAVLQIHVRCHDHALAPSSSSSSSNDPPVASVAIRSATLSIIDLAGSERASATQNRGHRLAEGASINRSLLALGNCINALCSIDASSSSSSTSSSNPSAHIPYRDSKLTRLLKYSLGGNCRVVMITNVSPAMGQHEETRNTLRYANRAKNIKTLVSRNVVQVDVHVGQYVKMIEALREEVALLRAKTDVQHQDAISSSPQKQHPSHRHTNPPTSTYTDTLPPNQDPVYLHAIEKAQSIITKIEQNMMTMTVSKSHASRNESLARVYTMLVTALTPYVDRFPGSFTSSLSSVLSQCLNRVDQLYAQNAVYRHNAGTSEAAIAHHLDSLDRVQSTDRWKSHPGLREHVVTEIALRMGLVRERWMSYHTRIESESQSVVGDVAVRIMRVNVQVMSELMSSGDGTGDRVGAVVDRLVALLSAEVSGHVGGDHDANTLLDDAVVADRVSGDMGLTATGSTLLDSDSVDDKHTATGANMLDSVSTPEVYDYDSCSEEADSVMDEASMSMSVAGDHDNDDIDDVDTDRGFIVNPKAPLLAGLFTSSSTSLTTTAVPAEIEMSDAPMTARKIPMLCDMDHDMEMMLDEQRRRQHADADEVGSQTPMRRRQQQRQRDGQEIDENGSPCSVVSVSGASCVSDASSIKTPQPMSVARSRFTRRIHTTETQLDEDATPVARGGYRGVGIRLDTTGQGDDCRRVLDDGMVTPSTVRVRHVGFLTDANGVASTLTASITTSTTNNVGVTGTSNTGITSTDMVPMPVVSSDADSTNIGPGGGPLRITPIRREHRRRMRQSLIPVSRPHAPRLVADNGSVRSRTRSGGGNGTGDGGVSMGPVSTVSGGVITKPTLSSSSTDVVAVTRNKENETAVTSQSRAVGSVKPVPTVQPSRSNTGVKGSDRRMSLRQRAVRVPSTISK